MSVSAVRDDGSLLGIGGFHIEPTAAVAFLDAAPGVSYRECVREIVAGMQAFARMAARLDRPIFALRDVDKPTSRNLLERAGFVYMAQSLDREVWEWKP